MPFRCLPSHRLSGAAADEHQKTRAREARHRDTRDSPLHTHLLGNRDTRVSIPYPDPPRSAAAAARVSRGLLSLTRRHAACLGPAPAAAHRRGAARRVVTSPGAPCRVLSQSWIEAAVRVSTCHGLVRPLLVCLCLAARHVTGAVPRRSWGAATQAWQGPHSSQSESVRVSSNQLSRPSHFEAG